MKIKIPRAIIEHRTNNEGYELMVEPSGKLVFYSPGQCETKPCSCAISNKNAAVVPEKWQHVAMTREGTTITLYANGLPVVAGTCANNVDNSEELRIGCNTKSVKCQEPLHGSVDEVIVVNRALSGAEILAQCKLNDPTGTTCVGP